MRLARFAATVSALALAATGVTVALAPASSAAGSSVYSVAPYVDMSNSQEGLLDTAITGHKLKAYTAAFVLGVGCNQIWGDTLPIGNDSYTDPLIAKAKSEGASVIVSSEEPAANRSPGPARPRAASTPATRPSSTTTASPSSTSTSRAPPSRTPRPRPVRCRR